MSDGDMVEAVARGVLHDKVFKEARERVINDATLEGIDYHLIVVAAEHGARAALSVIEGREGWQPIATAPKEDDLILVSGQWSNGLRWRAIGHASEDGVFGDWSDIDGPTHWHPLPSPPIRNGEG